jgi:hypothetical protein
MTTVVSELADKWLPLPIEQFFTVARALDMWFADELPPTLQDELRSPIVTQTKAMLRFQCLQQLAMHERQEMMELQQKRFAVARSRVGKRVNNKRH